MLKSSAIVFIPLSSGNKVQGLRAHIKKESHYLNNNFTSATSSSCLVVVKLMISMHFMSFAY